MPKTLQVIDFQVEMLVNNRYFFLLSSYLSKKFGLWVDFLEFWALSFILLYLGHGCSGQVMVSCNFLADASCSFG